MAVVDVPHVYVCPSALRCFQSLVSTLTFWRAPMVLLGRFTEMKCCSGATSSCRVWRKVPESEAETFRVWHQLFNSISTSSGIVRGVENEARVDTGEIGISEQAAIFQFSSVLHHRDHVISAILLDWKELNFWFTLRMRIEIMFTTVVKLLKMIPTWVNSLISEPSKSSMSRKYYKLQNGRGKLCNFRILKPQIVSNWWLDV